MIELSRDKSLIQLSQQQFTEYVNVVFGDYISIILRALPMATMADKDFIKKDKELSTIIEQKRKVLAEGKGLSFRGIPVERQSNA